MKNVKATISYSHDDNDVLEKLHKHLSVLRREGLITTWTDREILAGSIDEQVIQAWEEAELYLLLVSASFINSSYCYEREFKRALQRYRLGQALIVPIIARECDWRISELKQFKAYPSDGKAIISRHWYNEDEAFTDVISNLRSLLEKFPILRGGLSPCKVKPRKGFIPDDRHISPEQRGKLKQICDEIVQRLTVKAARGPEEELKRKTGRHFGIVWSQFNEHFAIGQLSELPKERFDEAKTWLLQYRASKDTKLKRANPHKYRNSLLRTIHALARELMWTTDVLHRFAGEKVGYAVPVQSLSELGIRQLEIVRDRIRYELTKRRVRSSQRHAVRHKTRAKPSLPTAHELLKLISSHPVPGERGLLEILFVDGSDPSKTFFATNLRGAGEILTMSKARFIPALDELVSLEWLRPLEANGRTRSYQFNALNQD